MIIHHHSSFLFINHQLSCGKELKQRFTIRPKEDKREVRAMKKDSMKGEVILLYLKRQMREEMDLTWKDFFEKNPHEKEEAARRWLDERLRSLQNSEDQDRGVLITAQNALRKKLRSEFR